MSGILIKSILGLVGFFGQEDNQVANWVRACYLWVKFFNSWFQSEPKLQKSPDNKRFEKKGIEIPTQMKLLFFPEAKTSAEFLPVRLLFHSSCTVSHSCYIWDFSGSGNKYAAIHPRPGWFSTSIKSEVKSTHHTFSGKQMLLSCLSWDNYIN